MSKARLSRAQIVSIFKQDEVGLAVNDVFRKYGIRLAIHYQ